MRINMKKIQTRMKLQIDKHRIKINFQIDDNVYLFIKHIVIDRFFHKLKNKMIDFYSIVKKIDVVYRLKLPVTLKIHLVQNSKYLKKNLENFLSNQIKKSSSSIKTFESDE